MNNDNSILRLLSAYSKCVNRKSSSLIFLVKSKDLSQLSKLKDVLLKRRKDSYVHIQAPDLEDINSHNDLKLFKQCFGAQILFVSNIKTLDSEPDGQRLLLDVIIKRMKANLPTVIFSELYEFDSDGFIELLKLIMKSADVYEL